MPTLREHKDFVVVAIVAIMGLRAIVRGFTMKTVEAPSLPSGRPGDYKSHPAQWQHRMFFVIGGAASIAASAYYVGLQLGWF